MLIKLIYILYVLSSLVNILHGQKDSTANADTSKHIFIGVHAVISPIANGIELTYTQDVGRSGEEFSIFFSGSPVRARQWCLEFTNATRNEVRIADRLNFNENISRYEITVRRHNAFATRYSKINYNQKRTFALRSSLGYRVTRWNVETATRPFFPSGFISFNVCGEGDGFDLLSTRDRFSESEIIDTSFDENYLVNTVEAGFGLSYRTSPLRRLMLALELNAFGLLPLNKARVKIKSPDGGVNSGFGVETKQQVAVNLDLSIGLIYRIR